MRGCTQPPSLLLPAVEAGVSAAPDLNYNWTARLRVNSEAAGSHYLQWKDPHCCAATAAAGRRKCLFSGDLETTELMMMGVIPDQIELMLQCLDRSDLTVYR